MLNEILETIQIPNSREMLNKEESQYRLQEPHKKVVQKDKFKMYRAVHEGVHSTFLKCS